MRLPRSVGDDPALHHAMITYASDYLLVDMAFREYPEPIDWTQNIGVSLTTPSGCIDRPASTSGTSTPRSR